MSKMSKTTNNQDIGAMLRKLAKTPGIVFNPKTGEIVADHTATTTGKSKTFSPQESKELLTHLQGICHAKEDLVAVPVARKPVKKSIVGAFITAEECVGKEGQWPSKVPMPVAMPAVPARTLPTRPKKVVCPKKDEESEWYCQEYNHEYEPLLHDGKGGFYCYRCENKVLCHRCEEPHDEDEVYYTRNSGTVEEEHYCEECYDEVRPDMTPA